MLLQKSSEKVYSVDSFLNESLISLLSHVQDGTSMVSASSSQTKARWNITNIFKSLGSNVISTPSPDNSDSKQNQNQNQKQNYEEQFDVKGVEEYNGEVRFLFKTKTF